MCKERPFPGLMMEHRLMSDLESALPDGIVKTRVIYLLRWYHKKAAHYKFVTYIATGLSVTLPAFLSLLNTQGAPGLRVRGPSPGHPAAPELRWSLVLRLHPKPDQLDSLPAGRRADQAGDRPLYQYLQQRLQPVRRAGVPAKDRGHLCQRGPGVGEPPGGGAADSAAGPAPAPGGSYIRPRRRVSRRSSAWGNTMSRPMVRTWSR